MTDGLVWTLRRWLAPSEVAIRHRPGRPTEILGRVSRAKFAEVAEFFARDLAAPRPVMVFASRRGHAWHFAIRGLARDRERQRVRNFLMQVLN